MAPLPNETRTLKTEAKKTRAREIVSDFIDRSLPTCTHDKERVVDVRVTMYPESQRGMIDVECARCGISKQLKPDPATCKELKRQLDLMDAEAHKAQGVAQDKGKGKQRVLAHVKQLVVLRDKREPEMYPIEVDDDDNLIIASCPEPYDKQRMQVYVPVASTFVEMSLREGIHVDGPFIAVLELGKNVRDAERGLDLLKKLHRLLPYDLDAPTALDFIRPFPFIAK